MSTTGHPSIQTFFSAYALPEASKRLRVLLKAAASAKVWKGGSPADLLWLCRDLQELVAMAFDVDARNKEPKAIINGQWEDAAWPMNSPDTFCGWQKGYMAWDFFPRHLSKKAFLNPYIAIEQFTSYRPEKEWKHILDCLLEQAYSKISYEEYGHFNTMLQIERKLFQLIEACHLIEVRWNERKMENQKTENT